MTPMNQGERLARIETLLIEVSRRLDKIDVHMDRVDVEHLADKDDLQKLKHQGAGILIGVTLAAGTVGAFIDRIVRELGGS